MKTWQIGDVKITRLQEQEPVWPGTMITANATGENALREGEWLKPFIDEKGRIKLSIHSLLLESEGRKIIVDTCVGNGKSRPGFKDWNNLQLPFLKDFEKSFSRDSIDMVVCTHLHLDHVGWNTVMENGKWVPTFPKATYMMTKPEWDHWSKYDGSADFKNPIDDSVRPVIDAKLAQLVEPNHRLTGEVWLESTPGHTPGHTSVRISSRGESAVITGDMIHHPIQVAHPDWICEFDFNPQEASDTRTKFVERYCDQPVQVFGTHFAGSTCGHIARRSGAFRFEG
ncbi:MAG TPA: MBL fold metallo-hydrolase [Candidatus Binataceae bacterium]|nr:MBL fold metallo-hydrolase [Candidatus Binataceae bacterium]